MRLIRPQTNIAYPVCTGLYQLKIKPGRDNTLLFRIDYKIKRFKTQADIEFSEGFVVKPHQAVDYGVVTMALLVEPFYQ